MEETEQLRRELERLEAQLHHQQGELERLRQQLNALGEGNVVPGKRDPAPVFRPAHATDDRGLENYIGLRLIHIAGIIVLVIGLSIGVKYAIDRNLISEGARILFAYGAGALLYILSRQLKKKYGGFSAILFSGAMASLYFTTYAAFVYYGMLPFAAAFGVMVALTLYSAFEAISYNRQEISLLGLVGAYAIPFLISANADQASLFFLYILIINSGVVFLSYRQSWLTVGRAAQLITWVLFIGWCASGSQKGQEGTGLLFLGLFFFLFTFNALAGSVLQRRPLNNVQAYQLLTNNVAVYTASLLLFAGTFRTEDLAYVSGLCALFAALQTGALLFGLPEETVARKLTGWLSLTLMLVYIANEWDGLTVTFLWLLLAIVLFGWGVYSRSVALRMASIVLLAGTLGKLVLLDSLTFSPVQKVVAYISLGVLLLVISFYYQKFREKLFGDAGPGKG